jgi:hypothetical protein
MLRGPDHIATRAGGEGTVTTVVTGYGAGSGSSRCPEADLPTYRVTYRPLPGVRRLLVDVEADELDAQRGGATLVLLRYELLVLTPRLVVVLRVLAAEAHVEPLCSGSPVSGALWTERGCGRSRLD